MHLDNLIGLKRQTIRLGHGLCGGVESVQGTEIHGGRGRTRERGVGRGGTHVAGIWAGIKVVVVVVVEGG